MMSKPAPRTTGLPGPKLALGILEGRGVEKGQERSGGGRGTCTCRQDRILSRAGFGEGARANLPAEPGYSVIMYGNKTAFTIAVITNAPTGTIVRGRESACVQGLHPIKIKARGLEMGEQTGIK